MTDLPELPEADEPTGTGGRTRAWRPSLTFFVAITAIALAIWEGLENRKHNRLTVQPRIGAEIDAGTDGVNEFVRLGIESTGLGPAVFTAFRIYVDGELQDTADELGTARWAAVGAALEGDSTASMNAQAFGAGYYLPVGREAVVFEASRAMRTPDDTSAALIGLLDRLVIQICYCSVYGTDCDDVRLTTDEGGVQPCPAD